MVGFAQKGKKLIKRGLRVHSEKSKREGELIKNLVTKRRQAGVGRNKHSGLFEQKKVVKGRFGLPQIFGYLVSQKPITTRAIPCFE